MSLAESLKTSEELDILNVLQQYWGYDSLRPMQAEAIQAGIVHRDSLVVMPTGGGKSLCYQIPPIIADRTDVVISPLIALMKDQVDGLRACGYPAVALHSNMSPDELDQAECEIAGNQHRLIFTAPERLLTSRFLDLIRPLDIRAFAIDEAHCISHWGHDFRPHYRQLRQLKTIFPNASIHAFTATATERVREDIIKQLGLENPTELVGCFDRPNLTYRVVHKIDTNTQIREIVERHRDEAVIIYCISRRETESIANWLKSIRIKAAHYHAGMDADDRRSTQDAFANEEIDVIVATVAFGMGVDRGDVRCVIHTSMPKSIEHYQQETGRAGRDSLPAECVLLYSPRDLARWEDLIRLSADDAQNAREVIDAGLELLGQMQHLCVMSTCRHRQISEYFAQAYTKDDCEACDLCLGESQADEEATVLAQKIISCVARVESRFGRGHVVDVLLGKQTKLIKSFGHDRLSTHGLLKGMDRNVLLNLIDQLVGLNLLTQTPGTRPIIKLNTLSWEVLRNERKVRLVIPKSAIVVSAATVEKSWIGVDRPLFEHLRQVRKAIANDRNVPPFVIFSDRSLRDMARKRPTSRGEMLTVHGVGHRKLDDLGEEFLHAVREYCANSEVNDG